jgi:diguanylate cyclase (GGDEF)-like protein
MPSLRSRVVWQTLMLTLACTVGSVAITFAVTFLATGTLASGIGLIIAVLAPAIMVPVGSYTHISLAAQLTEANEKLRALSETDPLTQVCNRRHFLDVAERQLSLARRHGFPTSVLLVDLDHFKRINDQFGHLAGDQALVETSQVITGELRDSDTLARFGGEEFIVLLPHTAREGALMVAERMMAAVAGHAFRHGDQTLQITLSIGGVTCETSETSLERLTSRADTLMYDAKQAGRNRCLVEGLPRQSPLPFREGTSAV